MLTVFVPLPKTSNENCANSHEEDHHQRHVKALLLVRRAAEKIISTSTLAGGYMFEGVEMGTCTHRSNCEESWLGTGGSALLHPSPPV